ncbi:MAG: phage tail tape measure protein [Candidatus Abawacabacteria bacterium]|nr:phage tail tape measure protein [Candidatus Abawacabacteria bacterium]
MSEDLELKLILKAINETTRPVKEVVASINGLSDTVKKFSQAIDKANFSRKFQTESQKSISALERLKKVLNQVQSAGQKMTFAGGGMMAGGIGAGYALGMGDAIRDSFIIEHTLATIKNTANLSTKEVKQLNAELATLALITNQTKPELLESISYYTQTGITGLEKLKEMATLSGKIATAENSAILDVSKTTFAATETLHIPLDQLRSSMEGVIQASKEGNFEFKDMAGYFPSLAASAYAIGMKGKDAFISLAAAGEVSRMAAGTSSEAAINLENLLIKMKPIGETLSKLNKLEKNGQKGLLKQWQQAMKAKDPLLEIAKILVQLKKSGVDVGDIFADTQAQMAANAMVQHLKKYQEIKKKGLSASGVIDKDFGVMMDTTLEQWKELKTTISSITQTAIGPWLEDINKNLKALNENPLLVKGIFAAIVSTIGIGAFIAGTGVIISGIGSVGTAFTAVSAVITTVGAAIGASSIWAGLSTISVMLGGLSGIAAIISGPVVIGIGAIIAVLGVLVYKYWPAIASFFRGFGEGFMEAIAPALPGLQTLGSFLTSIIKMTGILIGKIFGLGAQTNDGSTEMRSFGKAVGGVVGFVVNLVAKIVELYNAIFQVKEAVDAASAAFKAWDQEGAAKERASKSDAATLAILKKKGYTAIHDKEGSIVGSKKNKTSKIPGHARGIKNSPGGFALVGESGPELVNLPKGSDVIPNRQSQQLMSGSGGVLLNYNPTINLSGNSQITEQQIMNLLYKHSNQFLRLLQKTQQRQARLVY